MARVLFAGVFATPSSNNNPQLEAFRKAGVEVVPFDYRQEARRERRGRVRRALNLLLWGFRLRFFPGFLRRLFFRERGRRRMASRLLETTRQGEYDLIFLSKVEELDYRLLPELRGHAPVFYYFMDPVKTGRFVQADEYAKRATYASATFSDVVEWFRQAGADARQIVQGVDPGQYALARRIKRKRYDVVFAGTMDQRRRRFLEALREAGISVTCFGKGTPNGPVFNERLMKEYAKARIVLNLVRKGKGFSVRVFEAMASGSLLLTEYCEDLELFFSRGKQLDWFSSFDECVRLIKHYLSHEKEREAIAKRGEEMVFEKFTWDKQIRKILGFCDDGTGKRVV